MPSYGLTERARDDLFDVLIYGIERFGEWQADAYAADLHHVFQLLADFPRMGRKADRIGIGVRRHERAAHVILYEEATNGVTILAVIRKRSMKRLAL